MNDFYKRWKKSLEYPYPEDLVGIEINGTNVTSLDTYIAGCISSYIEKGRKVLDIELLRRLNTDLLMILPRLEDEKKVYFSEPSNLVKIILNQIK